MIIESKFDIGDEIWYLDTDNKPFPKAKQVHIDKIGFIKYQDGSGGIFYNGFETDNWDYVEEKLKENRVFATKEQLLNSL